MFMTRELQRRVDSAAGTRDKSRMSKTPVDAAKDEVRRFAARKPFSNREWARLAGISEDTVRRIYKDDWNPTADVLNALLLTGPRRPLGNGANQTRLSA